MRTSVTTWMTDLSPRWCRCSRSTRRRSIRRCSASDIGTIAPGAPAARCARRATGISRPAVSCAARRCCMPAATRPRFCGGNEHLAHAKLEPWPRNDLHVAGVPFHQMLDRSFGADAAADRVPAERHRLIRPVDQRRGVQQPVLQLLHHAVVEVVEHPRCKWRVEFDYRLVGWPAASKITWKRLAAVPQALAIHAQLLGNRRIWVPTHCGVLVALRAVNVTVDVLL